MRRSGETLSGKSIFEISLERSLRAAWAGSEKLTKSMDPRIRAHFRPCVFKGCFGARRTVFPVDPGVKLIRSKVCVAIFITISIANLTTIAAKVTGEAIAAYLALSMQEGREEGRSEGGASSQISDLRV